MLGVLIVPKIIDVELNTAFNNYFEYYGHIRNIMLSHAENKR